MPSPAKSLILYWSAGGNTKKVADAIARAMHERDVPVDVMRISEDTAVNLFDYDIVFFGAPSYQFLPPEPVIKYIRKNMEHYEKAGMRHVRSPKVPHKYAVVFCTYAGVHTGIKEATTAGKYMAQYFEHLGFLVFDEWYVVGAFHNWEAGSTKGKLGNICDRPNAQDLHNVYQDTIDMLAGIGV